MNLEKVKTSDGSVVPDQIQFSATLNGELRVFQFKVYFKQKFNKVLYLNKIFHYLIQRISEGDSDAMFDQIESRIHALKQQEVYGESDSDSDDERRGI